MAQMYYEKDANPKLIQSKKVAIIGYGSQGHAHAQNLRDSGVSVIIGQREGSKNYELAKQNGFDPVSAEEAARQADIVQMLVPDHVQAKLYESAVVQHLTKGKALMFAHGFNIHFKRIRPLPDIDVFMVAPKGPGHLVRNVYQDGKGVPSLVAVFQDASGDAKNLALSYAWGIGATRAGVLETTFAEETETDLFGEQCVLCGGVSELVKAGFDTLVEAGYQPEIAYFECMHELKLIVDLIYDGGLSRMRYSISDTAEYGDYTRGKRIVTDETRKEMKKILAEIRDGSFAKEWISECEDGGSKFLQTREQESNLLIEKVGSKLRAMMSWIAKKK